MTQFQNKLSFQLELIMLDRAGGQLEWLVDFLSYRSSAMAVLSIFSLIPHPHNFRPLLHAPHHKREKLSSNFRKAQPFTISAQNKVWEHQTLLGCVVGKSTIRLVYYGLELSTITHGNKRVKRSLQCPESMSRFMAFFQPISFVLIVRKEKKKKKTTLLKLGSIQCLNQRYRHIARGQKQLSPNLSFSCGSLMMMHSE